MRAQFLFLCFMLLLVNALAGHSHSARSIQAKKISFTRRHPEDKCQDVDVWTALYSEEKKHPTTTHVLHSHTDKGGSLPEYLFACNLTKTLPEDDVPEQIKDAFPYNMRTCFLESSLVNHKIRRALEVYSQKTFEKSCNRVNGVFTNPLYKTW